MKPLTTIKRYAAIVGVKNEKLAHYKKLHEAVWADVLALIKASHIQNYSIYLREAANGHHYLFSYFEYTGADLDGDMARMIANPIMQRWWDECVPCLELLPNCALNEVWAPMEEVFHLD